MKQRSFDLPQAPGHAHEPRGFQRSQSLHRPTRRTIPESQRGRFFGAGGLGCGSSKGFLDNLISGYASAKNNRQRQWRISMMVPSPGPMITGRGNS